MSGIPREFFWRRLHSLSGVFLVLFLIFHLLTNSQASFWLGDDGLGFVHEVNSIHNTPYLVIVEIFLLGVPFLIHMVWGVAYALSSEPNSIPSSGNRPTLTHYPRNHFFTWQRITAWILLFAVIAHVYQMRIHHYPSDARLGNTTYYVQKIEVDHGLYPLSESLGVRLMDAKDIAAEKKSGVKIKEENTNLGKEATLVLQGQREKEHKKWVSVLEQKPLGKGEVLAVATDFGTATLLMVRDTFKNIWMAIAYTFFVLFACFHAFNGLWSALITWGVTLSPPVQRASQLLCYGLMCAVIFLGLSAIWGTYWNNYIS